MMTVKCHARLQFVNEMIIDLVITSQALDFKTDTDKKSSAYQLTVEIPCMFHSSFIFYCLRTAVV